GPVEAEEAEHHYALLLTNLLSLTAFCFFLSYIIVSDWRYAPYLSTFFLSLGVQNPSWVEFIFRVHPDQMLMLFVGLSCYWILKYSQSKTEKDFVVAGLMWGLATAVKRSTILFIPAFIFLFLSEGMNRESLKKG